jgi:large repetitive protein
MPLLCTASRQGRHPRSRVVPLVAGLLLAGLAVVAPPQAHAAASAHDFADPVFSADARGEIVTIGNVTTTCDPTYANDRWSTAASRAACVGATSGATGLVRHDGAPMPPINNRLSMRHIDLDDDPTTFASTSARLRLPEGSEVLWAGLHWNGATEVPMADQLYGSSFSLPAPSVVDRFQVRLATPGSTSYETHDAAPADGIARDTWDDVNPGGTTSYAGFVDVTEQVRAAGAGTYRVADVQSCEGFGGCFGSWSITVAYAQRDLPPRNLAVWHGWQLTTPTVNRGVQEFTVNGLAPPTSGPVRARIGVVQADGDRGLGPDALEIASPSSPAWVPFVTPDRPLNPSEGDDWFNSTVTVWGERRADADASPNLLANLNHDIALVEDAGTIGNDDTSFSFRIRTAGTESLYSQVVHSAVDLYAPEIAVTKMVDPADPVGPGDEVTWTIEVRNVGIDPIRDAVLVDPLPADLTYVPGSLEVVDGGPTALVGAKTDAPGDDEGDWDPDARALRVHLGVGATATAGGTMGIAPATDGSDRAVIRFRTVVAHGVDRPATITNGARATGEGRPLADPFGPLTTAAAAEASVDVAAPDPSADLGIAKDDGDAVVQAVGDRYSYLLTATNHGPDPATGVTITDDLDPMLRFVASDTGCTTEGQRVTCPIGELAVDRSREHRIEVEVLRLPAAGETIPNVATVRGDQPDPDCVPPTEEAACNTATEATPVEPEGSPEHAIDLGITKDDGGAEVSKVGDRYGYVLTVSNAGPDTATGVTITDELSPMLAYVTSPGCSAAGQRVRCDVGELAAGAEASVELRVRVVTLPPPGQEIPNTAVVRADQPDPDCAPPTPDARCNRDHERTPRRGPAPAPAPRKPSPAPPRTGNLPITGLAGVGLVFGGLALLSLGGVAVRSSWRRTHRD